MIGAIIALSIIAFVLLCTTVMLMILYRVETRQHKLTRKFSDDRQYLLDRLTHAIEDVYDVLNMTKRE